MKKRTVMTGKQAQEHFLVSGQTLRRWDKQGKIEVKRTPGNTRRYVIYEDIPDPVEPSKEEAALEAEKEEAAKLKKIEADIEKYVALEDKNSLFGRYLYSYCIPSELLEGLEPSK